MKIPRADNQNVQQEQKQFMEYFRYNSENIKT